MLTLAVSIQSGLIGPLLDKNKMPRILVIHIQVVSDAVRLQAGFFHQLGVPRAHSFKVFVLDEVFGNHFQHVDQSWSGCGNFIGFKAVGPGHLPHARIELAIDLAGQQLAGF